MPTSIRWSACAALSLLVCVLAVVPAEAGTISVAWDPVGDADLAGYRIEYGTTAGLYDQPPVDLALSTAHTLTGLADCTTWHVAVKAVDQNGNYSADFSNEISGWPRPTVVSAAPQGVERGTRLDLVLGGTNFRDGATLQFSDPSVTVHGVVVDGCNQVTADITIGAGAALGSLGVEIRNPDLTFGEAAALVQVSTATPPGVVGTLPGNGATGVSPSVQPQVDFSEPLDAATVTGSSVRLLDAAGGAVVQAAGSPSLSAGGLTATITPANDLVAGATYRIEVVGGAGGIADLAGTPLGATFTQSTGFTVSGDSTPPVISAVGAGSITSTSAVLSWTTDEPADSRVIYNVTGQAGEQSSSLDPALVTSHGVTLQGLVPDTGYTFRVESRDAGGNLSASAEQTFITGTSTSVFLRFEAEAGVLTSPVDIAAAGDVFAGEFIETPAGTPIGSAGSPSGTARFGVNLPSSGDWTVWVRMYGETPSADSWFVSVDGGSAVVISPASWGEWIWVAAPAQTLAAGQHTLELGGREAATRADRILVTDDASFVPTEAPGADITPPAAPSAFSATPAPGSIDLAWTAPPDSDLDRIVIRFRTDGEYPASPVDGSPLLDQAASPGSGGSGVHPGTAPGTTYLYSIFAVDQTGNVSGAVHAQAAPGDNQPPAQVLNLRRTDVGSAGPP